MSIYISPGLASTLSTAGTSNNPVIAWDNLASGTSPTGIGAVVQSRAFAVTGTTYDRAVITPDGSSQASIEIDLGSNTSISFASVAAHNAGDVAGAFRIQYKVLAGDAWSDSGSGPAVPADNQAVAFYFAAVSARFWRIYATSVTANLEIGVFFLGNPVTLPRTIYQGYAPPITANVVDLQSRVSEGGNLLGSSVVRKGSTAAASLTLVEDSYLRADAWKAFQRHFNTGGGFFWAWRPTKYGDIFYAWRSGGVIAPSNTGPKARMAFDMAMRFYDDA